MIKIIKYLNANLLFSLLATILISGLALHAYAQNEVDEQTISHKFIHEIEGGEQELECTYDHLGVDMENAGMCVLFYTNIAKNLDTETLKILNNDFEFAKQYLTLDSDTYSLETFQLIGGSLLYNMALRGRCDSNQEFYEKASDLSNLYVARNYQYFVESEYENHNSSARLPFSKKITEIVAEPEELLRLLIANITGYYNLYGLIENKECIVEMLESTI